MAKLSMINNNNKRRKMTQSSKGKRQQLREIIYNKETDFDARMQAVVKLSEMPRNSSATRIRNRCEISGRPRGFHRRFKMSRIALRELGSLGLIPGLTKSSW